MKMSILEIYEDQIRDLLNESPSEKLLIKKGENGMDVPGITQMKVENMDAAKLVSGLLLDILYVSSIIQYNLRSTIQYQLA